MMLLLALTLFSVPADTLYLDQCYQDAAAHYPLRQEMALQGAISDLKLENLKARYFPGVSFKGTAIYHSEVPDFSQFPPEFPAPTISNDQYHFTVSVNQLIYDGGATREQKELETLQGALAQQEVTVELYKLRERVNIAYFNVLLLQAQQASLETLKVDLEAKLNLVQTRVDAGVLLGSNADVLAVELVKVEQQQVEAVAHREAALAVLGELIGETIPADAVLAHPEVSVQAIDPAAQQRPEYEVFALTKTSLAQQMDVKASQNRPQFAAFTDLSYGRFPGLNLFENAFKPYYAVGLRLSWKLWDWRTNQREQEALVLQQQVIAAREATFAKNIDVAVQKEVRDIQRLEELLQRDDEIITLRQRIVAQSASQLENGVITATDYLIERNAEHRARLTQQRHQVQLVQAKVQYATTIGAE